ncbi:MAG: hypothetical protein IMZ64_12055 [Bacteroidetes bacterium]|nr:hypothetical protein [Bacteroidota bacterium]
MDSSLIIPSIVFAIGLLGTIFAVYFHFSKPTEDLEKNQLITDKEVGTKATILAQKEMESKATLLAQQVEWEKQANEKKFSEFQIRLTEASVFAANHIHTVDIKVDRIAEEVKHIGINITKLATIIDERIPRKNN